jgi:phage/plasmid-associated DNA primase
MSSIEELKKLASRKIKVGQDVGIDEAQRFMNSELITKGTTPIVFAYLYYLYVEWRKSTGKQYISRRYFGRQIKRYLDSGLTKIGKTNYVTYKVKGLEKPKTLTPAWKLLWYEQSKVKKTKKTRRS